MARVLSGADVDFLLVGDSLGMVVYGDSTTHFVTLEEMIRHTQAVVRGHARGLVVADMPLGTYETPEDALRNVHRLITETDVKAVKLEGSVAMCKSLVEAGIQVMGHTGLKPQQAERWKVQGQTPQSAEQIFDEAVALEAAGCFAVILECIPSTLAQRITKALSIPTIGIGAGSHCDGQILVTADLLGLFPDFHAKFVRRYVDLPGTIQKAIGAFVTDVQSGNFPSEGESY
jgi:3-methyl-2-oxobutanoate hydroxymethyltransferase